MNTLKIMTTAVAVLTAALAASFGADGGAALAADRPGALTCGASIVTSTTLHADLSGCTGDGLVIAADGITLRLNGHRIVGDAVTGQVGPDAGIRVVGRHGVTISGGTIRGFDRGVVLNEAVESRITGVTSAGNSRSGIAVLASSTNLISQNTMPDNDVGIFLTADSSGNRVEGNTASGNVQGITIDGATSNDVVGNRLTSNGDGLIIGGSGNRITGNIISDAAGCGADCGGYGISLEAGQDNLIAHNTVSRTARDGIRASAFDPEQPTSGNIIQENLVRDAGVDGIAVATTGDGPVDATILEGNIVSGAAGDGIHINSAATAVTGNLAIRNARYGIEAVPGVRDGGGNVGVRNSAVPQCVNIRCSP